jgi:hypothetical protein
MAQAVTEFLKRPECLTNVFSMSGMKRACSPMGEISRKPSRTSKAYSPGGLQRPNHEESASIRFHLRGLRNSIRRSTRSAFILSNLRRLAPVRSKRRPEMDQLQTAPILAQERSPPAGTKSAWNRNCARVRHRATGPSSHHARGKFSVGLNQPAG